MEISNDTVQEIFDYLNEALELINNHSKSIDSQNETISTIIDYITTLSPQDLTELTARIEALEKRETVTPIYTTEEVVVDNELLNNAVKTAHTSLILSVVFGGLCLIMAAYIGFKHYKTFWKEKVLPMFRQQKHEKPVKPKVVNPTMQKPIRTEYEQPRPAYQQQYTQQQYTTQPKQYTPRQYRNVDFDNPILEAPPVMEEF